MFKCVRAVTPFVAVACVLTACSKSTTPASTSRSTKTTVPASTEATAPPTFQIASPQGTFAVAPTALMVGGRVTLSGTGCKSPDLILAAVGSGPQAYGTIAQVPTNPNGTWRVTTRVDNSTLIGPRSADARCVEPVHHSGVFAYTSVAVSVTTFRRVHVDRTSLDPGTKLTVTPTAACNYGRAVVEVQVLPARDPTPDSFGFAPGTFTDANADSAGNWSAHILVPANTPAGAYNVDAACGGSRAGVDAFYEPEPITVT